MYKDRFFLEKFAVTYKNATFALTQTIARREARPDQIRILAGKPTAGYFYALVSACFKFLRLLSGAP